MSLKTKKRALERDRQYQREQQQGQNAEWLARLAHHSSSLLACLQGSPSQPSNAPFSTAGPTQDEDAAFVGIDVKSEQQDETEHQLEEEQQAGEEEQQPEWQQQADEGEELPDL